MAPSAGFKSRVEQILGPSTQVIDLNNRLLILHHIMNYLILIYYHYFHEYKHQNTFVLLNVATNIYAILISLFSIQNAYITNTNIYIMLFYLVIMHSFSFYNNSQII